MFVEYLIEKIDSLERQGYSDELICEAITNTYDVDPEILMEIIKGHK